MDELFLYDRDNSIFKKILSKSKVIEGRYFIAPHYGHELNAGNLDQYFKEGANGLIDVPQKYPCVVTLPPKSRLVNTDSGKFNEFYFPLFFLCQTGKTGNNEYKMLDRDTLMSASHIWYDWRDMRTVCESFMDALAYSLHWGIYGEGRLRSIFKIGDIGVITPLTKFNNDQVTGVTVTISILMSAELCVNNDYVLNDFKGLNFEA